MWGTKPSDTSIVPNLKHAPDDGELLSDPEIPISLNGIGNLTM